MELVLVHVIQELPGCEVQRMSNLIVPDAAKINMAKVINQNISIYKIDLFKNNATIDHATVIGDLTVADFGGYAQQSMTGGTVSGSLDASFRGYITWDEVTFTRSSSPDNTIYGYFVTAIDGSLLWAEKFDAAIPVTADGIFIKITPKLTDKSQFLNT